MKKLKKKIKLFKYNTLFSENKFFFICLYNSSNNYSDLRTKLLLNRFKIKFIQNSFLSNLLNFSKIKNFLTGQLFCVLSNKLDLEDYLLLNDLLYENSHVILFYLDNKYYTNEKLQFLNKFVKSRIANLPYLSYCYFLLKLGFILKLEKLHQIRCL